MRRQIQTPPVEIIAHGGQDEAAELDLAAAVVAPMEKMLVDRHGGGEDLLKQRHEVRSQSAKKRLEERHRGARLVYVE